MSGAVKRYFIHLRGEETLHMAMDLNDYDVFLLQCVAKMSRGLATGYQPEMTVEAAPEGDPGECPSCGESLAACPLCLAPLNRDGSCGNSCAGVGDG